MISIFTAFYETFFFLPLFSSSLVFVLGHELIIQLMPWTYNKKRKTTKKPPSSIWHNCFLSRKGQSMVWNQTFLCAN